MNFSISYNIVGKGDTIVFIHGIGSRKYSWNCVIKILKNKFRCISYDLRGHGKSKIYDNKFTLSDLVKDLEKLRKHLKIKKFHIVGHSLGGMIGPLYARKYQYRVKSLSLLSTAAFRKKGEQRKIVNIINKIKKVGLDQVLSSLIDRWFTQGFIKKNQNVINKRIQQVKTTHLKTFLNVFEIYAKTEMDSWLNELNIPCLIMTGEKDISCNPKINKKIADSIINSKLVILKNLKHSITVEAPQLVGKKINFFLKKL
tara:strand:+ start:2776 stop:3543 length:768 start_codon:yes stop_codon:yes gene_type:complete